MKWRCDFFFVCLLADRFCVSNLFTFAAHTCHYQITKHHTKCLTIDRVKCERASTPLDVTDSVEIVFNNINDNSIRLWKRKLFPQKIALASHIVNCSAGTFQCEPENKLTKQILKSAASRDERKGKKKHFQ